MGFTEGLLVGSILSTIGSSVIISAALSLVLAIVALFLFCWLFLKISAIYNKLGITHVYLAGFVIMIIALVLNS